MPTENRANSTTRIAIVTGGSRGLGRNTVLSLGRRGLDSIFTYKSNQAEARKVVGLVAEAGRKAAALPLDTRDSAAPASPKRDVIDKISVASPYPLSLHQPPDGGGD